jgi:hypothetical protein
MLLTDFHPKGEVCRRFDVYRDDIGTAEGRAVRPRRRWPHLLEPFRSVGRNNRPFDRRCCRERRGDRVPVDPFVGSRYQR